VPLTTKKSNKGKTDFSSAKFVTYDLSKEQRAELKGTIWDVETFDTCLTRLNELGYKITFRDDEFNGCKACWLIPTGDNHPNSGYILSGRGSTPLKALKQASYIHYQIFDQEWSEHYLARAGEEMDD